jgi:hypothetical protein
MVEDQAEIKKIGNKNEVNSENMEQDRFFKKAIRWIILSFIAALGIIMLSVFSYG